MSKTQQKSQAPTWDPGDDELVPEVQAALGGRRSEAEARAVVLAAEPLWEALSELGLSDGWGGGEFRSTFPVVLKIINDMANWGGCRCSAWAGYQEDDCPDLWHQAKRALSMYHMFTGMLAEKAPALARLDELHALGLLTDEQWREQRRDLLRYPAELQMRARA